MNDLELADRMEHCSFPNAEFHHEQHLQLAWHYLRTYDGAAAADRMQRTILNFAISLGHAEKYHATATIAWMLLVEAARRCTPQAADFDAFLAGHAWLQNREARAAWVAPDLRPLPADL